MPTTPRRLWLHGLLGVCLFWTAAAGAEPPAATSVVSIVIDDLGNNPREGRRVIALPGPIGVAILPHTPHAGALAQAAHDAGKEVLLHLPMDAEAEGDVEPGPGRIEAQMPAREIAAMLAYDLETVPHARGVNNHMGSRLTRNTAAMDALMRALHDRGNLFFLDSRTTPHSVAAQRAREHEVPALERDVFLDNERGEEAVGHGLQRLEHLLTLRGRAIAIGHPYPETLAALERWLPAAAARGIRVVPLSTMLEQAGQKTAPPVAATTQ